MKMTNQGLAAVGAGALAAVTIAGTIFFIEGRRAPVVADVLEFADVTPGRRDAGLTGRINVR